MEHLIKYLLLLLFQSGMQEARWHKVQNQRVPVVQPGSDHQRGGCRGYREGEHQRVQNRVDKHEQELGPKLANKRGSGWSVTLIKGHRQWPSYLHHMEHCPCQLAIRPDVRWEELQGVNNSRLNLLLYPFFPGLIFMFKLLYLTAVYCVVVGFWGFEGGRVCLGKAQKEEIMVSLFWLIEWAGIN